MSAPMQIVRLSDRRWVQIAVKILKLGENSNATVWTIGNTAQTLVHDLDLTKFGNKTFQFQRMEIHFPTQDFRIVFARGAYSSLNGNLDFNTFRTSRQSASYDEIYLPPTGSLTPEQANSLDKIITEVTFERFAESPKQNDDLTRIVLSQLDQLRTLSLEFSERQLQAEKNLEARFSKKQSNFDKEMIEARNNLEDDKKKLEAYRLQINDREPQHERRRLREALTNDLRETLSSSTPSSSSTVNRVFYFYFLASIALLIVSAVYAIEAFGNLDAAFWARTIRSTLAGIAGVAFAWAGLSGLRNAAISERDYEKSVRRYAFDMDRASWIVETLLQMNSNEQMRIPDDWLKSVCRSLFENNDKSHDQASPLESIAALFEATAKAKIGTNGIEFEIDRKGAKKLASEA